MARKKLTKFDKDLFKKVEDIRTLNKTYLANGKISLEKYLNNCDRLIKALDKAVNL